MRSLPTGRNSDEMDLEEITEELQKKKKVKKFLKKKKDQLWTYYLDKSEFYVPIVI